MSVKLILLKSEEKIISDAKELISENSETGDGEVYGYLFSNPYKVMMSVPMFLAEEASSETSAKVTISPWMTLSKDTDFLIPRDWVVTIMEPIDSLKQMYEEQVNG